MDWILVDVPFVNTDLEVHVKQYFKVAAINFVAPAIVPARYKPDYQEPLHSVMTNQS